MSGSPCPWPPRPPSLESHPVFSVLLPSASEDAAASIHRTHPSNPRVRPRASMRAWRRADNCCVPARAHGSGLWESTVSSRRRRRCRGISQWRGCLAGLRPKQKSQCKLARWPALIARVASFLFNSLKIFILTKRCIL